MKNTKSELDILRQNARALINNSKILREEAHAIRKSSNDTRNEIKILIKEAHAIKNKKEMCDIEILKTDMLLKIIQKCL